MEERSASVDAQLRFPSGTFIAVQRAVTKSGAVRLKSQAGPWLTEYTPRGRVTLHCLPSDHTHFALPHLVTAAPGPTATAKLAAAKQVAFALIDYSHCLLLLSFHDRLRPCISLLTLCSQVSNHLLRFPMLQRWVGVQYHPQTEFMSHYGEVCSSMRLMVFRG